MQASKPFVDQGWWTKHQIQSVHNHLQLFHKHDSERTKGQGAFLQTNVLQECTNPFRIYLDCDMTSAGTSARHLLDAGPARLLGDLSTV